MAIVQISKLQQRSGNLVDLPQLDEAEFGWASDAKKLYIGKETPVENIEVLTSYSTISFSQIDGSVGNLNIVQGDLANGQVLTYTGTEWTNRGATSGGLINLGNVSNVKITGGAASYVLTTDGTGNLSFSPQGVLYTNILAVSSAATGIMTVANTTPYTNGQSITVSGVLGTNANTVINGQTLYVQLAVDFATTGNVSLYTDSGLTTGLNTTTLTATPNTGIATAVLSTGGGVIGAGGSNTQVQFNDGSFLAGNSNFTFNKTTSVLTVVGNINVGNLTATSSISGSTLTSTVSTGTAPLTVTSTTRVTNLNVARAGNADSLQTNTQTTGTFFPVFVSASSNANYALNSNTNLVFNAATGNLSTTILNATGNVSGGNITTAGVVSATGNVSGGNITTAGVVSATGNISGLNLTVSGNVATSSLFAGVTIASTTSRVQSAGDVSMINSGAQSLIYNGYYDVITSNWKFAISSQNIGAWRFDATAGNLQAFLSTTTGAAGTNATMNIPITINNSNTIIHNTLLTTTLSTGSSATAGSVTGNWTLTTGSRLQATYADLAEYYSADDYYQPGTVLEFGGMFDVTLASDGTNKVAGVVSTDPAYAMNAKCPGLAVAIALQGRVPCKVRGNIEKGDMLISAGNGFARASMNPTIGSVIGKALENFNGTEGTIEVAVGRL